jgi:WhiB family redox-sensing transcriptional regulator
MDRSSFEDLAALIESTPRLDGALCRGSKAWDCDGFGGSKNTSERDAAVESAIQRCGRCPALSACLAWLHSLTKAQLPNGVVAGQLVASIPARSVAPGQPRRPKVVSQRPRGHPRRLQATRHG